MKENMMEVERKVKVSRNQKDLIVKIFGKHPNLEVQRIVKQNGYHKFTLKDQNNNINKSETDNVNRDISENVLWLKYSFGQHS